MERMKFESDNLVDSNIEKIEKLFPNCITEGKDENGKLKKAINFDMLKQMLSKDVVEGDEAYEFTWVGKKESIVEAHKPIRKTLRPCKEESVNGDKTENLYIEGDNLDVLKLLRESYLNKVKMIYIDPPYNTGNDFIYRDKFSRSQEDENREMGMYDEDDNKLFRNTDTNGRFHSDWCTMIYSRLMLARSLLSDDGVIFISIDDHELHNLRNICDEVFGEKNFVSNIKVLSNPRGTQSKKFFATSGEYIIVFSKNIDNLKIIGSILDSSQIATYNKEDEFGKYREIGLRKRGTDSKREDSPTLFFPIYYNPRTKEISLENTTKNNEFVEIIPKLRDGSLGRWRWSKSKVSNEVNQLVCREVKREDKYEYDIFQKDYLKNENRTKHKDFWIETEINYDRSSEEIRSMFTEKIFDYAKPLYLIQKLINTIVLKDDNSIIMDFFSGSATTAHAVMQLNAEDGGNRKFIMVQTDKERCDEKSEAFKAGYKNICEIGKERIRRAGKKIIDENPDKADSLDIGFRTFKLDSTNMKDVYYSAGDYTQNLLDSLESNIKSDRTDLDLLFGCLLEWGLPLSMPYKSEVIDGCTVHIYNDGDLIACFDENISDEVIKTIANRKPLHAVFRDSSFKNSPSKINSFEIFKMISPDTKLRVI